MFSGARSFNQPLSWDMPQVETLHAMFAGALGFNQPVKLHVPNVRNLSRMFFVAQSFNSVLTLQGSGGATDMCGMFRDATDFNQPLTGLKTSSV